MSTVHVVLSRVNSMGSDGDNIPVVSGTPTAKQTLTGGASSVASTITAANVEARGVAGLVWAITARDADIWVKFGTAPTAAAGSDWLIMTGETRYFGVGVYDEKVAVINA